MSTTAVMNDICSKFSKNSNHSLFLRPKLGIFALRNANELRPRSIIARIFRSFPVVVRRTITTSICCRRYVCECVCECVTFKSHARLLYMKSQGCGLHWLSQIGCSCSLLVQLYLFSQIFDTLTANMIFNCIISSNFTDSKMKTKVKIWLYDAEKVWVDLIFHLLFQSFFSFWHVSYVILPGFS